MNNLNRLIDLLPEVVLHFLLDMSDKESIYEKHRTLNADLMREFLKESERPIDWSFIQIVPNVTTFKARMLAFEDENDDGTVKIREIHVPNSQLTGEAMSDLEGIFKYGQNDFQPQQCCSLSVGDVVEYDDKLFVVASMGFREITQEDYDKLLTMDCRDRHFSEIVRPK